MLLGKTVLGLCQSPLSTTRSLVSIVLEIPEELVLAAQLPENELVAEAKNELALAFYGRGLLSIGKAKEWSGLRRPELEKLISDRQIERPWTEAEVDRDLNWAKAKGSQ